MMVATGVVWTTLPVTEPCELVSNSVVVDDSTDTLLVMVDWACVVVDSVVGGGEGEVVVEILLVEVLLVETLLVEISLVEVSLVVDAMSDVAAAELVTPVDKLTLWRLSRARARSRSAAQAEQT